jgi:hypothetical protein
MEEAQQMKKCASLNNLVQNNQTNANNMTQNSPLQRSV